MKLTGEQREMLRDEYRKVWGERDDMTDYCVKKASCMIELRGYIVDFDKPSIETRFCFGEHTYDYDEVMDACHAASESEDYFTNYNMEHTEAFDIISALDGEGGRYWRKQYPVLKPHAYIGQGDDCRLAHIEWTADASKAWNDPMALTDSEKAELRQLMVEEQEKFAKRVKTYLKRYGLSKCSYWTYWADR